MRSWRSICLIAGLSLCLGSGLACGDDDDDDNGAGGTGGTGAVGGMGGVGGTGGTGASGGSGGTDQVSRDVELEGAQEVPPVGTGATGSALAELDGSTLTVNGDFSDLGSDLLEVSGSSAHVHRAEPGENGAIVFNLEVTPGGDDRSGSFTGTAELTEEQRQDFLDGLHYVNVHTVNYPGGELRGQLADEVPTPPDELFEIELSADQEVDEVESAATGVASISRTGDVMTVNGSFAELESPLTEVEGSSAHVHEAPAGENGDIVFNLEVMPDEGDMAGTFQAVQTLTEDQQTAYEAGELYINVHTEDNPGGEIRGQIEPPAGD